MRLEGKVAMIVGAGQTPGSTIGNGRAVSVLFAREGARVLAVDRDLTSAEETVAMIRQEGGEAEACQADVTSEPTLEAAVAACSELWGRVDILHNNVGVSLAGGDAPVTEIEEAAFDRLVAVNLRGMVLACKHALPIMREQESGSIINISSVAAVAAYPLVRLQDHQGGRHRTHRAAGHRQRSLRHSGQCHPARVDEHTHGHRSPCAEQRQESRGDRRRA